MKIVDDRHKPESAVKFDALTDGQVFERCHPPGIFYQKTEEWEGWSCFTHLNTGKRETCARDMLVIPLEAELHIIGPMPVEDSDST